MSSTKTIAQNTLFLYFRMILVMGVSLYTSRVILNVLGVSDYGVYNVIGGVVAMSSFITSSMSNGIQRFITYTLGEGDKIKLRQVFAVSVNTQYLFAFILLIILETVGLWFINTQLNLPNDRINAANWVFQFSILALVLDITTSPYLASIIAYERMSVFAYLSILEVSLKLGLVFLLPIFPFDRLKIYAILMFVNSFVIRIIYQVYCRVKIKDVRYQFYWNKELFASIISFSGWNMFGGLALMMGNQGVSVLLNIFFGVIVNAAQGIAMQVKSAIYGFHNNILTALKPPIIKAYAQNNINYMTDLVYRGAKYSFLMLLFLSLPIISKMEYVIQIWLKTLPDYAVTFTQLMLIISLIDCLSGTIMTVSQATGNIKKYQIIVSAVLLLQLPLSYVVLKLGFKPESVFYVNIFISIIALFVRIHLVHLLVNEITIKDFLIKTIFPVLIALFFGTLPTVIFNRFLHDSFYSLMLLFFVSSISIGISSYFIAFDTKDRKFVNNFVRMILQKRSKY